MHDCMIYQSHRWQGNFWHFINWNLKIVSNHDFTILHYIGIRLAVSSYIFYLENLTVPNAKRREAKSLVFSAEPLGWLGWIAISFFEVGSFLATIVWGSRALGWTNLNFDSTNFSIIHWRFLHLWIFLCKLTILMKL